MNHRSTVGHGTFENSSSLPRHTRTAPVSPGLANSFAWKNWTSSGVLGVLTTAIATGLSIVLIPTDFRPNGALRLPGLILAAGMIAPIIYRFRLSVVSMVHPLHVVAAAPVYWVLLDVIQGAYSFEAVRAESIANALLCTGLFSIGIYSAALHRPWALPRFVQQAADAPMTSNRLMSIATIAFILAFCRFAIPSGFDPVVMLRAFHGSRWSVPWGRAALGGWNAFLDHLVYFGYVLPPLAALQSRMSGWFSTRTVLTGLYGVIIMALASTDGSRRIVGVMLGSAAVVWFLSSRHRPGIKQITMLLATGVLILAMLQVMLLNRNTGLFGVFETGPQIRSKHYQHLHVDDNFLRLCQITEVIPAHHPHVTWQWPLWVAVRPIPRALWRDKPTDFGFNLPEHLGIRGVSLSMSVIGEAYMAFGFPGCLVLGWIYGSLAMSLATFIDRKQNVSSLLLFSIGLLAMFAGVRSAIELVLMSYGMLAWVAVVYFWRRRSHSQFDS